MSRTRIVKGKITEIIAKDYNIYSDSSIIDNAAGIISDKGVAKGESYGNPLRAPLAPQPIQLIVEFRPNRNWKGEFGFDWLRMNDTKLFNDNKFEEVVSYQYLDAKFTKKVDHSDPNYVNKYDGVFKADETMFNKLKKEYKPYSIPWKNKKTGKAVAEEYYIPWLSLIKDKEAKITFFAEINQEADYLEFTKSDYFTFTPNKIDIKGKKNIALNDVDVTIKCIKEFAKDQTIELKAFKNDNGTNIEAIAGKLNVWANDATRLKEKNVVFVEIKTPELLAGAGKNKPNVGDEKDRINQYLAQAYIKLSTKSDIVELDLTAEKDFMNFVTNNEIDHKKTSGGKGLADYLKSKLQKTYPGKYSTNFKAFYFAENGYHPSGGYVSGFSAPKADYVVVFRSKNKQTASHEFLHSMNLPHTFTNKDTSANAQFTYEFTKTDNLLDYSHRLGTGNNNNRCSLYFWQWKQANASIK